MAFLRRKKRLHQKARRVKWNNPEYTDYYGAVLSIFTTRFSYGFMATITTHSGSGSLEVLMARFHYPQQARLWVSWWAIQTVPHLSEKQRQAERVRKYR